MLNTKTTHTKTTTTLIIFVPEDIEKLVRAHMIELGKPVPPDAKFTFRCSHYEEFEELVVEWSTTIISEE